MVCLSITEVAGAVEIIDVAERKSQGYGTSGGRLTSDWDDLSRRTTGLVRNQSSHTIAVEDKTKQVLNSFHSDLGVDTLHLIITKLVTTAPR